MYVGGCSSRDKHPTQRRAQSSLLQALHPLPTVDGEAFIAEAMTPGDARPLVPRRALRSLAFCLPDFAFLGADMRQCPSLVLVNYSYAPRMRPPDGRNQEEC